jgi:hypothetical protein
MRTAMTKHLLLVDYENVHRIDLSVLDESYRAIIFVGAGQNPPRAARHKDTAHRFSRVDFQQVAGSGKNALDFHIAFHLGRTFETAADTVCIVVSKDKGYDPLLLHLNNNGLRCRRVESFAELVPAAEPAPNVATDVVDGELVVCKRCGQARTIEHHGGRWCTNCGCFASPPDPNLLPSNQPGYREPHAGSVRGPYAHERPHSASLVCGWCDQPGDMDGGIYDDGEWMCASCIARYAR